MKSLAGLVTGAVIGMIVLVLMISSLIVVQPGTVEIVIRMGKVTERLLSPGPHFINPFVERTLRYDTRKVIYIAQPQEKAVDNEVDFADYPVDTNTKDGQPVIISYTLRFSVDPTKVAWIAQNIGDEGALVEKIVKADSRIWIRNVPREYDAAFLYAGNVQVIQSEIFSKLQTLFDNNGVILDEVGIREITFSEGYVKAIEQKQIEAVRVETEKNKAAQAEYQKKQRIVQAEGMAQEQQLQKATLTSEMLQKIYLEKWDGHLPTFVGGNGNGFMFTVPKQ